MINGSPLHGSASLSFLDSSSLLRLDDAVERVEIIQGGTSAIFSSGQPDASANFILRTGSDKTTGSLSVTGAAGVPISHYFGSFAAKTSTCSICGG